MKHLPHTITALIEISFNRYLALDPEAKSELKKLSGKALKITIRELDLPVFLLVTDSQINVLSIYEDEVDASMRASVFSLAKLALASDSGESLLGGEIEMSGNMEVGRQFRNMLKNVDIDWEEVVSKYTGDIVAHQLGNTVRAISQWGNDTVNSLSKDLSEYLQEESRDLPSPTEVKQFLKSVDDVRLAVERAEARIKLLKNTAESHDTDVGGP